jgi:hypothetical protein
MQVSWKVAAFAAGAPIASAPTAMAPAPRALAVIRRQSAGVRVVFMVISFGLVAALVPRSPARSDRPHQFPQFFLKMFAQ